jgi:hypothetical protein
VAERGTFAELAAGTGLFARMLDAQRSADLLEGPGVAAQSAAT